MYTMAVVWHPASVNASSYAAMPCLYVCIVQASLGYDMAWLGMTAQSWRQLALHLSCKLLHAVYICLCKHVVNLN